MTTPVINTTVASDPVSTIISPATLIVDGTASSADFILNTDITTSNLHAPSMPSARLTASYQTIETASNTTVTDIKDDMMALQQAVANYGIDPVEILHMANRWLCGLLDEFKEHRDDFKNELKPKWINGELKIGSFDSLDKEIELYTHLKKLQAALDWTKRTRQNENLRVPVLSTDDNVASTTMHNSTSSHDNNLKNSINQIIHYLEEVMESLEIVDGEATARHQKIKNILENLKALNDKELQTICVFGLEKGGKSTYINALLGEEILPTDIERCTQIRTVVKPISDDNRKQNLFAEAKFYDNTEFEYSCSQMKCKTNESQSDFEARKINTNVERQRLMSICTQGVQQFKKTSDGKLKNEDKEKLDSYIRGEQYVNIIKEISMYSDKLPGKGYELRDVPGFDSPIKEHRDEAIKSIKSADGFIYVTDGQRPSLQKDQLDLLKEIQGGTHYDPMQRAFGIITRLDQCQTLTLYKQHLNKSRDQLLQNHFRKENIFPACSLIHIPTENSEQKEKIENYIHTNGFVELQDGFEKSRQALNDFIEHELPKTHMKQLNELAKKQLARHIEETITIGKSRLSSPFDDEQISSQDYHQTIKLKTWDRVYEHALYQPAIDNVNMWLKETLTKQRKNFFIETGNVFRETFLQKTSESDRLQAIILQRTLEQDDTTALHANTHPIDDQERKKLVIELHNIVSQTSDKLAEYLYSTYICQMEERLNENIYPEVGDLFHVEKMTLGKCKNETNALVMRICEPLITATLRYSHKDTDVREDAINHLLYIAPIVAQKLCNNHNVAEHDSGIQMPNIVQGILKVLDITDNVINVQKIINLMDIVTE